MSGTLLISLFLAVIIFSPVYNSKEIIIEYGIKPFDICSENPILWEYIKKIYIFTFIFSNLIINNIIYNKIIKINKKINTEKINKNNNENKNAEKLNLLIGYDKKTNSNIYIPEKGLYQNFLITGTIGTGKTSSAMYPITRQLMEYNYKNPKNKIGMLILDVKGNYYNQVKNYAKKYNLEKDLIILELNSKIKYNPLHKPNLKPQILANRIKTILTLFSENNSESFWLDKAEQIICECIKLCRLYNDGYVTFLELHKIIMYPNYYKEKIEHLRQKFIASKFSTQEIYELNSSLEFFQNEFEKLDSRTMAILKSEISRLTLTFISDFDVQNTFCPNKEALTFTGFSELIKTRKNLSFKHKYCRL